MYLEVSCSLRGAADGSAYLTDGRHNIIDASFGRIPDAKALASRLNKIPGVVENGLFTEIASRAIVATDSGTKIIEPSS